MSTKDYQARFLKLQDVKQKRMNEPLGSANRLDEQCESMPMELMQNHGYHRDCYQCFTKNLGRLKTDMEDGASNIGVSRRSLTK